MSSPAPLEFVRGTNILLVNYASAIAFELRQPTSGGTPFVRLGFKNGSDDAGFTTCNMFNAQADTDTSLEEFTSRLGVSPFQVFPRV